MKIMHIALAALYPLLRTLRYLKKISCQFPTFKLRVLLYHNVEESDRVKFDSHIKWIKKNWEFITPEEFEEVMSGRRQLNRDSILLTFDDGYGSNFFVAKQILAAHNIKAIFFVVTNFISASKRSDIEKIIKEKFFPFTEVNTTNMDNMTWQNLMELSNDGHSIGGHTRNHARLSLLNYGELRDEIYGCALDIRKKLNICPKYFAYTFGDLDSFSQEALNECLKHFKLIFTGLRGFNNPLTNLVARDAMDPKFSNWLIGSFLEGGADFLYSKPIRTMNKWIK